MEQKGIDFAERNFKHYDKEGFAVLVVTLARLGLDCIDEIKRLLAENKAYETNNKNQAIEIDKAYEMIGELQKIVDKYQEEEIFRLAGGE